MPVHTMVQHAFTSKTNLPEDQIVNTFHFLSDVAANDITALALALEVERFYWEATAPEAAVMTFLATDQMGNPKHSTKVYDMSQDQPRVPVLIHTSNLGAAAAGAGFPSEVAVCLSFKRTSGGGDIPARRRGRVYIGPLNNAVVAADQSIAIRVHQDFQESLLASAVRLQAAASASGHEWMVYSPTTAAAEVGGGGDFGFHLIDSFWVDNAFDIVRSRGPKASGRLTAVV